MGGVLKTVGGGLGSMFAGPAAGLGIAGGGKGGGAPSAPDFTKAATAQQTNPFGVTSQWNQDPNGQLQHNQSFSGPLGQAASSMEGQAASAWGQPLDNGAQARQHAQDAIYGQETSRLDPQWQQRQHDFQTQLANQGIDPNSAAYSTAQGNFDRGRNDAYQQANYGSIIGGGQEAQRQQQMDLTSRFAPEQGLAGLAGLTGQGQNPLLPAAIAQYQGALQNYGIQQQGKNSTMNGLMGLGGNLGAASIMAG